MIRRVAKIVGVFFLSLLILVVTAALLVHLPVVQKFGIDRVAAYFSNKIGAKVSIDGFSLFLLDDISLRNVYIEDQKGDTLLYADQISLDFDFSKLLNRKVEINKVYLVETKFLMSRKLNEPDYNFQFIIDSFKSESPSNSTPWEFLVQTVFIRKSSYSLYDIYSGIHVEVELGKAEIDIEKLGNDLKLDNAWFYDSSVLVELFEGADSTNSAKKSNNSESNNFLLTVNDIKFKDSKFEFNNQKAIPTNEGIDWNYLSITAFNSTINKLSINQNEYSGKINELNLVEKSGFQINQLVSDVTLKLPSLVVDLEEFKTPNSNLSGLFNVSFSNVLDILNESSKTLAEINLLDSKIATSDLLYFMPDLDSIAFMKNKVVKFDLDLKGNTDNLSVNNLELIVDQNNSFKGGFAIRDLLDASKVYVDGDVKYFNTQGNTLQQLIGNIQGFNLNALGRIKSNGKVRGSMNDFKLKLNVNSSAGKVQTDIAIGLNNEMSLTSTNGDITVDNIALGKLLYQDKLGRISGFAQFETKDESILIKQSRVDSVEYNQYTYSDIRVSGTYKNKKFDGAITANDQNAKVDLNLVLNLSDSASYKANGQIQKIDFYAIKLFNRSLTMSGQLDGKFAGNHLDNISGYVNLDSLTIASDQYAYFIDSVKASTALLNSQREVKVVSGFFNIDLTGNFTFTELPVAANNFVSRYYSEFQYQEGSDIDSLNFSVNIEDTKGILRMFIPEIKELKGLALTGTWNGSEQYLRSDLKVQQLELEQVSLSEIGFFIDADKRRIDVRAHSGPLALAQGIRINKPDINGYIVKDSFYFHVDLADSSHNSGVDIQGLLALEKDTFYLNLDKIVLELNENIWKSDGKSKLVFSSDYIDIQNFNLEADTGQSILIQSEKNVSSKSLITAKLENVHLDEFSKIAPIGFTFDGIIDAQARIENLLNDPTIIGEIKTNGLLIDNQKLGDLRLSFNKQSESPNLKIRGKLIEEIHELDVSGHVDIMSDTNHLDFKIFGRQFQLASIQPFLKEYVYDLDGNLDTRLQVSGSIQEPLLTGEFHFTGENRLGIQATKTLYTIKDERLSVSNSLIDFGKITLYDKHNQRAFIEGEIQHNFLKDFYLDIHLFGKDFLFLDSKEEGLIPFYGKLSGELDMSVKGPKERIVSQLRLVTNENTDISMALLTNQATYTNPEYIRFLNPDTVNYNGLLMKHEPDKDSLKYGGVDPSSFNIAGEIEVTKKAKVNIIIDEANGDKISATGQGSFQFKFDSEGDMNLFGTYEVDQGDYTFTFMDLIKREFEIDKGSTISWQGDAEDGIMDVTAKYKTKASIAALVDDGVGTAGVDGASDGPKPSTRPVPVTVFLFLKGELTTPEITFDIEMSESSESGIAGNIVTERLNQIKSEDAELNKQVMGIIAFNQFLPYQGWDLQNSGESGNLAASSVSKAMNAQLGQLSDKLGGVDIQVDVDNSSELSMDRFNLMATKQFSDRLSVSIGGNFGQANTSQSNSVFAGDYIVFYQLNKSGTLSLKIFSKRDPNLFLNYVQQVSGATIHHTKEFDHLKNWF